MEKHWTAYLPEAGRIKRKGDDIQYQHRLLVQAKTEVQQLTRKIADMKMKPSKWQKWIGQ